MHPYITQQIANERIKSLHQEAAATRRVRTARELLQPPAAEPSGSRPGALPVPVPVDGRVTRGGAMIGIWSRSTG